MSKTKKRLCGLWLVLLLVCAVAWGIGAADRKTGGAKKMTHDQLIEQLKRLEAHQQAEMDALSERVAKEMRAPVRSGLTAWLDADPKLSANATAFLSNLEELAIVPLLNAPDTVPTDKRVWMLRTVAAAELELREKVVARIEKMLDDKTPVPPPKLIGRVEEKPLPRRVCDEAYMQLRMLLNTTEERGTYFLNCDAFLNLSEPERDDEIRKARQSRTWTKFVEEFE